MPKSCETTTLPKALLGDENEAIAHLCKALGNSSRVKILKILIAEGTCLSGDLAENFDLAQSTVSEHLRLLKEAGLIQGTIDGPRRSYCVNDAALKLLKQHIKAL